MTDDEMLLAGELALGLLDGDERAAALRQVIADPAFAREVERWRMAFAGLTADYADVTPVPAVEDRVTRRVEAPATPDRWRWVAALAGIAAAVLLVVVVSQPASAPAPRPVASATPREPLLVAILQPKDAEPVSAIYDPRDRAVRLSGPVPLQSDRDLELWVIGGDGVPRAAGLVPRGKAPVVAVHPASIAPGVTLALSVEPVGGSPKPTPTGPVIATGKLAIV